jgi:hypothetical protein
MIECRRDLMAIRIAMSPFGIHIGTFPTLITRMVIEWFTSPDSRVVICVPAVTIACRVSFMTKATTVPEIAASTPTAAIAETNPNKSANTPEASAPIA